MSEQREKTKRKRRRRLVGPRDVCALAGLSMVAGGLSMVHVPTAIVTTGGILLGLAVAGSLRRPKAVPRRNP